MALTDTAVRQAKPSERAYTVSDGDGLALFVHPRGDKYWHFRYRASGRAQRVSLGTYPEVSLKEARLRREARRKVAAGVDPREKSEESQRARSSSCAKELGLKAPTCPTIRSLCRPKR